MTLEEVAGVRDGVVSMDSRLWVAILNHFPIFRRRLIRQPAPLEMTRVEEVSGGAQDCGSPDEPRSHQPRL